MARTRADRSDPFVSNQETGVYFWASGSGDSIVQLSTHPHPLLPHHCERHRWWSDRPCMARHRMQQMVLPLKTEAA